MQIGLLWMVWNVWKAEAGSRMKIEEEEDVMGDGWVVCRRLRADGCSRFFLVLGSH